jgi:RNA polymerase sigma-70 factor, ECF subfamily
MNGMFKVLRLRLQPRGLSERSAAVVEDDLAIVLHRSRSGDRKAMRTLLVSLGPPMLQVIRRVLGACHPDVEDTLQEATIALVRALASFRGECSVQHFGCRIATFTAISCYRRRAGARTDSLSDHDDPTDVEHEPGSDGGEQVTAMRRRQLVRRLLADLPNVQGEALALHCMAGFTVSELASATSVPRETARSRLRLAKAALRERIVADPAAAELLEDLS